jgi:hypothetical protein
MLHEKFWTQYSVPKLLFLNEQAFGNLQHTLNSIGAAFEENGDK